MSQDSAHHGLRGSCLCGGVTYEVRGPLGEMGHCHCSMCRKAHGAAFGTYAPVGWDAFEVLTGEHLISEYRSSETVTRTFCSVCGSTLQYVPDGRAGFGLAVGTLDDDPRQKPVYQIWTRDKAPWWDLTPEPPSFATEPSEGATST